VLTVQFILMVELIHTTTSVSVCGDSCSQDTTFPNILLLYKKFCEVIIKMFYII
jgi:hypothetical protein